MNEKDLKELFKDYEQRLNQPERRKIPEFQKHGRLNHIILADQLDRDLLEHLCESADMIRELHRVPEGNRFLKDLLPEKRAMLYFTQASTRTFLSFTAACQILGITCNEIRDPTLSSEFKGETSFDAVRMFSSYFDVLIMRSKTPRLAESCAYLMNDLKNSDQRSVPIINGGAGADEHPTQALLDIYTIRRSFSFHSITDTATDTYFDNLKKDYKELTRGISNKKYCFCGDIGRSRTIRSLIKLLIKYDNVKFYFVAPKHKKLCLSDDVKVMLRKNNIDFWEEDSLDDVISDIDMLYMTRVQHEHDVEENIFETTNFEPYKLTPQRVSKMRDYAKIMHPFPRLDEIPKEVDSDPRALYFRQARNGMWARAALLCHIFDVERKLTSFHKKVFSDRHDYNEEVL